MTARRWLVVAVPLAATIIVGAVALSAGDGPGRLDQARALLDDHRRFETALDAGESLARVGALLLAEGRTCRTAHGDAAPRCQALLSASAYAQVVAAQMLTCTAPGRFEARQHMRAHVDVVDAVGDGDPVPPPPPSPDCR